MPHFIILDIVCLVEVSLELMDALLVEIPVFSDKIKFSEIFS